MNSSSNDFQFSIVIFNLFLPHMRGYHPSQLEYYGRRHWRVRQSGTLVMTGSLSIQTGHTRARSTRLI